MNPGITFSPIFPRELTWWKLMPSAIPAQIKNVTVSEKAVLDFSLGLQYTEQNAVVVTGQSKATQIKRSPVPIVTMSHADIVGNLSTNIIDAIAKLPGVTQLTTGPNVSKPFIRGLGL